MTDNIHSINGGAVVAMRGNGCVAIGSDKIFGVRFGDTFGACATNHSKVYQIHPHLYVGFPGLNTDSITCYEKMRLRANMYTLKQRKVISPETYAALLSNLLYTHRFTPYYVEPIVVGLMPEDKKPYVAAMDLLGSIVEMGSYAAAGSCVAQLYGMCESVWRPDLNPDELFETIGQVLANSVDADSMSGWGAVIHVLEPTRVLAKHIKTRMD